MAKAFRIQTGETEFKFHTYYWHDGKQFGATFYAKDFEDAKRKVASIRRTLDAEDVSQVLEEFENKWFYIQWVKFTIWIRNVFHR